MIVQCHKGLGSYDSRAFCCWIFIHPDHCEERSLIEHELVHVRQFYRTLGIHIILYEISSNYRLRSEVEAYRAQLAINLNNPDIYDIDCCMDSYAYALSTNYRLNITYNEALWLIR